MKFKINGKEIKTIKDGATIHGSLNTISRSANFSYIYAPGSGFETYKAKMFSPVSIENDEGKNIFTGIISSIIYDRENYSVEITAEDYLYLMSKIKTIGRFNGTYLSIIENVLDMAIKKLGEKYSSEDSEENIEENEISILDDIMAVNSLISFGQIDKSGTLYGALTKKITIPNYGKYSAYDIIKLVISKIFKNEFKIYLDGNFNLKILFPYTSDAKREFIIGKDILKASFSQLFFNQKTVNATLIGDSEIVSGSVIKISDLDLGKSGYFIVTSDTHAFSDIHTMDLTLKERGL